MKLSIKDIGGSLIKENDQYELYDNSTLKNLIVSKTRLRAGQSTNGHRHAGQEEVYFFDQLDRKYLFHHDLQKCH